MLPAFSKQMRLMRYAMSKAGKSQMFNDPFVHLCYEISIIMPPSHEEPEHGPAAARRGEARASLSVD